jgi:hypothetical protein
MLVLRRNVVQSLVGPEQCYAAYAAGSRTKGYQGTSGSPSLHIAIPQHRGTAELLAECSAVLRFRNGDD